MREIFSTILAAALIVRAAPLLGGAEAATQPSLAERSHADHSRTWEGYRQVGYYPNWAIYDDIDFLVTDINSPDYTHLLYAFANVDVDNGTVYLSDTWADLQYAYPGDEDEDANQLAGNAKQLFQLKKQQRNLKTLLSVGGWSYRENFVNVTDRAWREEFARSSVALIEDLGMDGIDIDYEYATNETKEATVELLNRVRHELDRLSKRTDSGAFLMSYAAPCGAEDWINLDISRMDHHLDMWNLMAYDFSGDWSPITTPASNLYPDPNPQGSGVSVKQCADYYLGAGATARKINIGMPTYGTAFNGTSGMWTPYTCLGDGEQDEPGFFADRHLPLSGEMDVYYNAKIGASWSYSPNTTHLTSFDIPYLALEKAKYVVEHNLGGMAYWSVDSDWSAAPAASSTSPRSSRTRDLSRRNKWQNGRVGSIVSGLQEDRRALNLSMSVDAEIRQSVCDPQYTSGQVGGINITIGQSLVHVVTQTFDRFGGGLDRTHNALRYPDSAYANIRSC